MDGFIFFWFTWSVWIYATFIMDKNNKLRYPLACFSLILIILSHFSFRFFGLEISLAAVFLLLVGYKILAKKRLWLLLYMLIAVLTISLAYCIYFMFSLYDPVRFFIHDEILFGIITTILSSILCKHFSDKMTVLLTGMVHGDLIYAYVLHTFQIDYPAGSFSFLDHLISASLIMTVWHGWLQLQRLLQQKLQQEREKQVLE